MRFRRNVLYFTLMTIDHTVDESTSESADDARASTSSATKKNKGGRPRWEPPDADRAKVKMLAAMGISHDDIAKVMSVTPPTLRRACRIELSTGKIEANAKVAQSLYKQATHATKPNVIAGIFWMKSQAGWRDRDYSGSDETHESPAKKEERQREAQRIGAQSKFSPGRGPHLAVDNTKKKKAE